jgi:hypothetical protein
MFREGIREKLALGTTAIMNRATGPGLHQSSASLGAAWRHVRKNSLLPEEDNLAIQLPMCRNCRWRESITTVRD